MNGSRPRLPGAAHLNVSSLLGMATAALAIVAMAAAYRWADRDGTERLLEIGSERLELYAAALESELGRLAYLPALVAIDTDVAALLAAPGADTRARAARKLARLNAHAGSQLIYIADADGHVLATSEVGGAAVPPQAVAERRRLEQIAAALQSRPHGFFAAEAPGAGTDYYQARPFSADGTLQGWIIVRINLAPLEATWVDLGVRSASEKLLVLDDNDVVIMSSVPPWSYRTLTDVAEHWQAELQASARYPARRLASLALHTRADTALGARLVEVPRVDGAAGVDIFVAQERALARLAVRFVALSDPGDVWRTAVAAAWSAGAVVALTGLLAIYLLHRRRALVQLFRARNELQHARDDLERQVTLRTRELLDANAELERQIEQRRRSEDELIQAGKLAVLGQMSAGIAHELNQPLTALRALAGNTLRLLDAGRGADAAQNLRSIGEVAERMGRITSQLKTFARRAGDEPGPVSLQAAVGNVRLLLEHRLQAEGAQCEIDVPGHLFVRADSTRLEQVVLNLASNALDAMAGAPQRRLTITAQPAGTRMLVRVADTGSGMDDAALARLFEPFFTTKPAGVGLGLGLVISSKIVREFGGTLQGRRGDTGMVFEFDLALSQGHADV